MSEYSNCLARYHRCSTSVVRKDIHQSGNNTQNKVGGSSLDLGNLEISVMLYAGSVRSHM